MPRYAVGKAKRGSQMWLQRLVNESYELINRELSTSVPDINSDWIHWLSPVTEDKYAEYRDKAFIQRVQIGLHQVALKEFWPRGGPVWDGLAKAGPHIFLIEAKAHIPELNSSPMKASQKSAEQIARSLQATKDYLGSGSHVDWSSCFYQYTNRLAHLYLLRTLNDIEAWLINIYFVGDEDMDGPRSVEEWNGAIRLMKSHLGLGRHSLRNFDISLFFDVRELNLNHAGT
jgi:hypothetical protein